MTGRGVATQDAGQYEKFANTSQWKFKSQLGKTYNLSARKYCPVILTEYGERKLAAIQWGLIPSFNSEDATRYNTINARAETFEHTPAYQRLKNKFRCVVLMDGFYEWHRTKTPQGKTRSQPYYFHVKGQPIIAMAGLYDIWKPRDDAPESECHFTFSVLTTQSSDQIDWINPRMPVILQGSEIDEWLSDKTLGDLKSDNPQLLQGKRIEGLEWYPVHPKVNKASNDTPDCIKPLEGELQDEDYESGEEQDEEESESRNKGNENQQRSSQGDVSEEKAQEMSTSQVEAKETVKTEPSGSAKEEAHGFQEQSTEQSQGTLSEGKAADLSTSEVEAKEPSRSDVSAQETRSKAKEESKEEGSSGAKSKEKASILQERGSANSPRPGGEPKRRRIQPRRQAKEENVYGRI